MPTLRFILAPQKPISVVMEALCTIFTVSDTNISSLKSEKYPKIILICAERE